jgi:hypothetical protein
MASGYLTRRENEEKLNLMTWAKENAGLNYCREQIDNAYGGGFNGRFGRFALLLLQCLTCVVITQVAGFVIVGDSVLRIACSRI